MLIEKCFERKRKKGGGGKKTGKVTIEKYPCSKKRSRDLKIREEKKKDYRKNLLKKYFNSYPLKYTGSFSLAKYNREIQETYFV